MKAAGVKALWLLFVLAASVPERVAAAGITTESPGLPVVKSIGLLALLLSIMAGLLVTFIGLLRIYFSLGRLKKAFDDGIRHDCREYENRYGKPYKPPGELVELFRKIRNLPLEDNVGGRHRICRFCGLDGQGCQSLLRMRHSFNRISIKSNKFIVNIVKKMATTFRKIVICFSFCFRSMFAKLFRREVRHISSANVRDHQSPLASGAAPAREAGLAGGGTEIPKKW